MISFSNKKLLLHILCVALFLTYEISITIFLTGLKWYYFIPYYLPGVALFYGNIFLLQKFWKKIPTGFLILLVLGELILHFWVYMIIDTWNIERLKLTVTLYDFLKGGYRTIYFFGISIAYWLVLRNKQHIREIYNLKLQALELQNRQVALENAYLRSKANPHLTFNVLNILYGALEQKMPPESKAVKLLSETMDYAMGRTEEDGKVMLKEEIRQVVNIIELHQYLQRDGYQIDLDTSIIDDRLRIPPLVLVTLVDNIFMHGQLSDSHNPAIVRISCNANQLSFRQTNLISSSGRLSHGLGLEFVTRCLSFYYPDRHQLMTESANGIFSLNLLIEL